MKKYRILFLAMALMIFYMMNAQVSITSDGSNPAPSAMLDVQSNNKGLLLPRMSTANRDGIGNPAEGLVIYNTDSKTLQVFDGVLWSSPHGGFSCRCQILDIDSNVYNTIEIGTQCWMGENLATTRYTDGTAIPLVTDNSTWASMTSPAYCWYDNDSSAYAGIYGALYNWYVVDTSILCPVGWHVPSDDEWKVLEGIVDSLYGVGDAVWDQTGYRGYDAGKRLKSTSGWLYNGQGTDIFGFTALPGGWRRYDNGNFGEVGFSESWWTSSMMTSYPVYRMVFFDNKKVYRQVQWKDSGYSVRCLKD